MSLCYVRIITFDDFIISTGMRRRRFPGDSAALLDTSGPDVELSRFARRPPVSPQNYERFPAFCSNDSASIGPSPLYLSISLSFLFLGVGAFGFGDRGVNSDELRRAAHSEEEEEEDDNDDDEVKEEQEEETRTSRRKGRRRKGREVGGRRRGDGQGGEQSGEEVGEVGRV